MAKHENAHMLPIAVSCGEPAGIGPDVILMAWQQRAERRLPTFYVLGDTDQLAKRASLIGLDIPVRSCTPGDAASCFADALPVCALENRLSGNAGHPEPGNAQGVIEAIDRAVSDTLEQKACAVVTAPIAKKPLYDAGFKHPGHTEYLAELAKQHSAKSALPVMMIAGPELRTVPVTIHIPLGSVSENLTTDAIISTVEITHRDLQSRFGIKSPRIAVSGLNPHAGEGGAIGSEDSTIIEPAVRALAENGIDVTGPLPADTMFHAAARATYDVAVCMYHDQALIPAKALGFDDAVNVTLGLPFIRTSPDHGTAFDIAGTGKAKPDSFIAALKLAAQMAARFDVR